MEHDVSGAYREKVHSVGDVLGTWGHQAVYHRQVGPSGLDTKTVGWPRLEASSAACDVALPAEWDLVLFCRPAAFPSSADWPEDNLMALALRASSPTRRRIPSDAWVKLHPPTAAYGSTFHALGRATLVTSASLQLLRSARLSAVSFSNTGISGSPRDCIGTAISARTTGPGANCTGEAADPAGP